MTLPNSIDIKVRKEDSLNEVSADTLTLFTNAKHMTTIDAIFGDDEVRVEWPGRDDPLAPDSTVCCSPDRYLRSPPLRFDVVNFPTFEST